MFELSYHFYATGETGYCIFATILDVRLKANNS